MFNSAILEVATGIVFIYLLLSLMCTALREGLEGFLKTRASYLEYGVRELLHDLGGNDLARQFYQHPLIYSLFPGDYTPSRSESAPHAFTKGNTLPSYIPARNFATALMDLVARGPSSSSEVAPAATSKTMSIADIRASIATLNNAPVQRAVLTALDTANGDLEKARKNLENWYDSAMDRVSGRYKRSTQLVLFGLGFCIAVGFNIDTITLADYLYRNETQRGAIVAQAAVASGSEAFLKDNFEQVRKKIDSLRLPIGWNDPTTPPEPKPPVAEGFKGLWQDYHGYFMKPLGWLLTAFAVTLGAPFWFDILNKIMVIRSTVKPHEKSPEEASEDRQGDSTETVRTAAAPTTIQIIRDERAAPVDPQDSHEDGCDATVAEPTRDCELPAAQGGALP